MKKLFKNLPLALLVLTLSVGCGKDNSSGGASGTNNSVVEDDNSGVSNTIGDKGYATNAQNYNDLAGARAAFNAKSFLDGINVGSKDPAESAYNEGTIIVRDDGYFRVTGGSNDFVELRKVGDTQAERFDRNSASYKEMLGLTGKAILGAQVSDATVVIQGSNIPAKRILIQYDGYQKEFLVSTNLPLAANPIIERKTTEKKKWGIPYSETKVKGQVFQFGDNQIQGYTIGY